MNEMISKALEYLAQQARQAAGMEQIKLSDQESLLHDRMTGATSSYRKPERPKRFSADTVDAFAALVATIHADVLSRMDSRVFPLVLVGRHVVTYLTRGRELTGGRVPQCEPEYCSDRIPRAPDVEIYLSLTPTDGFAFLQKLRGLPIVSQEELVLALRTKLAGMYDPAFLSLVRTLRVDQRGSQQSSISAGAASMGRSIELQAMLPEGRSIGDLPETVEFIVPVYIETHSAMPAHSQIVTAAFDVKLKTLDLSLLPLSGQLEGAVERTRAALAGKLETLLDAMLPEGVDGPVVRCGDRATFPEPDEDE